MRDDPGRATCASWRTRLARAVAMSKTDVLLPAICRPSVRGEAGNAGVDRSRLADARAAAALCRARPGANRRKQDRSRHHPRRRSSHAATSRAPRGRISQISYEPDCVESGYDTGRCLGRRRRQSTRRQPIDAVSAGHEFPSGSTRRSSSCGVAMLVYVVSRYPLAEIAAACRRLGPLVAIVFVLPLGWQRRGGRRRLRAARATRGLEEDPLGTLRRRCLQLALLQRRRRAVPRPLPLAVRVDRRGRLGAAPRSHVRHDQRLPGLRRVPVRRAAPLRAAAGAERRALRLRDRDAGARDCRHVAGDHASAVSRSARSSFAPWAARRRRR